MRYIFLLTTLLISFTANAAQFKCYSSKYPADMQHYFGDGYTIISVSKKMVTLKYYYINEAAGETSLELEAKYRLNGVQGGSSALKGMFVGALVDHRSYIGDPIQQIYFTKSLFQATPGAGIVGKFAFPGHGYSYDWNICYNEK